VRPLLVAFNVDVDASVETAQAIAHAVRRPGLLQALGLHLPRQGRVQVSMNLVAPERLGVQAAWDGVAVACADLGRPEPIGAEIVGLVPRTALDGISAGLEAATGASAKVLEDALAR
jgi:glutamate formiminotransferase